MSGQQQRRSDGAAIPGDRDDDELSIIDVFEFDDTANDRWLCSMGSSSRRNSAEGKVEDLDAWLHADLSESDMARSDTGSRRSIDTRTFTRIKRRSGRLSLDSVGASVSPETMPFSLSNVWKHQTIPESLAINNNNDKDKSSQKERRDSIPMMLRPKTNQVLAALLSESPSSIHSRTSMEAFTACSKEGINSLLSDMSDPDVSQFLMNISQPSLLYSSIISDVKGDENVYLAKNDSFCDSQILTDSMMEASMFKEVQDTSMLTEFLKQSSDYTVLEDKTFCKSSSDLDANDETYIKESDNSVKSCNETFLVNGNDTFSLPSPISKIDSTKILTSQENLLDTTHVIINTPNLLNSTKILSYDHPTSPLSQNKNILSATHTINDVKTDLTFEIRSTPTSPNAQQSDATFQTSNISAGQIPQVINLIKLRGSTGKDGNPLDETLDAIPSLREQLLQEVHRNNGNKFNTTCTITQMPNIESKFDVTYQHSKTTEYLNGAENLDATYVQFPLDQPESQATKRLGMTYDSTQVDSQLSNSGSRRLSYTKKNTTESQTDRSRFNTFRKDSRINNRLSKVPQVSESNSDKFAASPASQPQATTNMKSNDNLYQQRFNTFSKKTLLAKNNPYSENNVDENKLDNKFKKPVDKFPKQIQAPRRLSKLPQLFQKSNPNLGSSLKPHGRSTLESETGFNKGSQPNISSLQPLSRFNSEQRLLQSKHSAALADSTSRSMESIGSDASVRSAPDLDDRLSMCSNSSRASYTIKSKNVETLKKLANVKEQDGKLVNSSPMIRGRQILENTWVEERNLPSPILKNEESGESRSTSPTDSSEFNAKTSSPLTISPSNSDQAINVINDNRGIEEAKENIQTTENIRPKQQLKAPSTVSNATNATKLRRPSNWTGGQNKVANGAVSGIPRPASRIPAPKFARSNLK